jgi:hypothetical protein
LQGADGGLIVKLFPAPLPPRVILERTDGTTRVFDLIDSEGERATYNEIVQAES